MRPAQEWTESDIEALIREQRPEDLSLEYKAADALKKHEKDKAEISKDVSAMANSAGGTLVYGISEQRQTERLIILDPIDPKVISLEWLEQVIDSRIQRRIPELRVHRIDLTTHPENCVYVISIPASNLAPHMASDHRFYKRLGTTTAMMEEYEVRDVSRRIDSPDLDVELEFDSASTMLKISPSIRNNSPIPALYASIRLFHPTNWKLQMVGGWRQIGRAQVSTSHWIQDVETCCYNWAVPRDAAILCGYPYPGGELRFSGFSSSVLGWEIQAPHMETRRGLYTLKFNGLEIEAGRNPLAIESISKL